MCWVQIEQEVTEAMMKSLRYCDLLTESARQPLYQYRAATIHHRLAPMYHSCFRNQVLPHFRSIEGDVFDWSCSGLYSKSGLQLFTATLVSSPLGSEWLLNRNVNY